MKRIFFFSVIALITLLFASCRHSPNTDLITPPPPPPDPSACDTVNVTYTNTIQSIIRDSCYTCHAGSPSTSKLYLDSYDSLKYKVQSKHLIERIKQNQDSIYYRMPPIPYGKLSDCQIAKIQRWSNLNFPQ